MLFNSYVFLFGFLPVLYGLYRLVVGTRWAPLAPLLFLAFSLIFYGWHRPEYLLLVLVSVAVNYALCEQMNRQAIKTRPSLRRVVMILVVLFNLALLGYFKYAGFFLHEVERLSGWTTSFEQMALPLAISFFTFQQIGYAVDIYTGRAHKVGFLKYFLFVLFFPQLIAGPICRGSELLPQLRRLGVRRRETANLVVGLTVIAIGLFKKTVIADTIGGETDRLFALAADGGSVDLLVGWAAALCFTFQIYFDFSGYSDIALGLARLFGVRLPINFFSPYKAHNISDFWRRWHITLSRFLRDHIYIPLGGNRASQGRTLANLFTVMVLGGLWHGAGWTFVCWGGLHGAYLAINHLWRRSAAARRVAALPGARAGSIAVTFLAVVAAWVLFRAETLDQAIAVYEGMMGLNGVHLPWRVADLLGIAGTDGFLQSRYISAVQTVQLWAQIVGLTAFVWLAPNTYQLVGRGRFIQTYSRTPWDWSAPSGRAPLGGGRQRLRATASTGVIAGALFAAAALAILSGGEEFLYFEF
jgi:alginate O-acetyltransferase complex protein AlgI